MPELTQELQSTKFSRVGRKVVKVWNGYFAVTVATSKSQVERAARTRLECHGSQARCNASLM